MNECLRYQEMISALIDGELSGDEHSALLAHMRRCHECSALYSAFSQVSAFSAADDGALPLGLHEDIMAGVRREAIIKSNKRGGFRHFKSVIAAAACFAVVLFAVGGAVTELSRRAAVTGDEAESAGITAVTDAIATMDVQAAGDANAAVYAQANMAVPTQAPKARTDEYLDEAAPGHTAAEDPYLSTPTPAPNPAPAPAAPAPAESAPVYEQLPAGSEPAATESVSDYEQLPQSDSAPAPVGDRTPAQAPAPTLAATGAPVLDSAQVPVFEALPAEDDAIKVDVTGKLSWQELSALLLPSLTEKTAPVPLPEGEKDALYAVTLSGEDGSVHEILVYRYGESLYVSLPASMKPGGVHRAECDREAFEKLIAPFLEAGPTAG